MKALTLLLLYFTFLFSNESLTLKESYRFDDTVMYAKDFFPQLKDDFVVITIPDHLMHFTLAQQRIFDLFEKKGIKLQGTPRGLIHFNRHTYLDYSAIEREVAAYYTKHLPFLTIKSIDVTTKANILSLPKTFTIEMKKQAYKNHQGTLKLLADTKRYFFEYKVNASYSFFQTTKTLRRKELLTASNTKLVIAAFKSYHSSLIGFNDLDHVRVRKYIKKGQTVYQRDVEVLPLVKKGSDVNVKVIEGNILINFSATAQNDGALNEIITIKRQDGTRRKAKVVGLNKVELQ